MINKLLTIKHWQIFLLTFGIPFIMQVCNITWVVSNVATGGAPDGPTIFSSIKYMFAAILLFMAVFFGWFYAVGTRLHEKLPASTKMNLTLFKIFFFFPMAYILCFVLYAINLFTRMSAGDIPNPSMFAVILPLHLFSMFCIFYCLYFNAKALKSVELQRPVTFSDFAGEFCLIWFFPIGIWIIQPRINKLFDNSVAVNNMSAPANGNE